MSGETILTASLIIFGAFCLLAGLTIGSWARKKRAAAGRHVQQQPAVSVEDLVVARHWGFTEQGWMSLTNAQRARYRSDMLTQIGWKA